ncbi:hypothetical protein [Paenibacillus endoradicis]|uniref:hypothetical protein n=1 Tax=Paenibacillus endoradicis TaxID=2972487 RepID=UPI00215963B4|nr:hypothetical protein [Paenibacillus endoradicis]MCR8659071.1 hypothetical protein [Paenibacillus endoradicis]
MKLKSIAGGNHDDILSNEHTKVFRSIIEKQTHRAFPHHNFMQFVKTLSDYDKLMLAIALQLPFTKKDLRKWPDLLFLKKLSTVIKKASSDITTKQQLLIYITSLMIVDAPSIDQLNEDLIEQIATYGYWNVYWTIYYHPDRENNEDLCIHILEKINSHHVQEVATQEVAATVNTIPTLVQDQNKYEKKIAVLEDKISKEITTRQQLELSGVQKDKLYRHLQQEQDKLTLHAQQLKEQLNMYEVKVERMENVQQEFSQKRKEEEERWLIERSQLLLQTKQYSDELKKSSQIQDQLQKELEESKKQSNSWQQIAQQKQEQAATKLNATAVATTLEQQLTATTISLHRELDQYNETLIRTLEQPTSTGLELRTQYRQQMRNVLELIENIENYQITHNQFAQTITQAKESQAIQQQQADIATITEHNDTATSIMLPEKQGAMLYGTFYRRDHGGYISLENGDIFNITESLVQQLELQHEAEVLCTPTAHPGRHNHYTIELLFQGDDNFSPINQYDGFVHQDEDLKWYCVDLNDEDNRFPIHFKDVEIQKPGHGDPCTFNVAEDGHIARLTRLYRLHGDMTDVHPARKKSDKPREAIASSMRNKVEPFLTDCTITIIGGQRKWFETVVKETGAELVHDGGERPERIASDLSRSQALFMILTSTSHRATWEGIEIAKMNQVPHFVIQGSKSNLRMLLWENQELIRSSNRME